LPSSLDTENKKAFAKSAQGFKAFGEVQKRPKRSVARMGRKPEINDKEIWKNIFNTVAA
jgi:hypothetical protein